MSGERINIGETPQQGEDLTHAEAPTRSRLGKVRDAALMAIILGGACAITDPDSVHTRNAGAAIFVALVTYPNIVRPAIQYVKNRRGNALPDESVGMNP